MFLSLFLCSLLPLYMADTCSRVQACTAQLSTYPQIEEDSSGWGSGMVPLYDEVFETSPFDYSQTPEVQSFSLCDCPGNQTCDAENSARNLKLDETIQLTFCQDVETQLSSMCKFGMKRDVIKIIGTAESSGRSISSVTSTLVFCSCPTGYLRRNAEMWAGDQLAVQYKCL